ncbi:MAG: TonB-dependent receptor, partial [bacterium]|nr:TonB-dependent receptor [bacterium]
MHAILLAVCCVVSGHVHTASGSPLAGARVVLRGPTNLTLSTDAQGSLAASASPGDYQVDAVAPGYEAVSVDVKVDHDVALDITLEPLDAPTLRTIGHVTVDGRLAPLRGVIPAQDLSRADMARMGQTQITQSLLAVPSVTFARPDGGGDAAIATVALRGPDPSETLVGLDGQLLNDANTGDIDLSRFPVAAFSSVDLTEGLGPQDSEGSNTIGGAINLVSLRP